MASTECPRRGFHPLVPVGVQRLLFGRQVMDAVVLDDAGWRQVKINSVVMNRGPDWVVSRVRQALCKNGWRRQEFLYKYSPLEAPEVPISGQKLKCDRRSEFRIVKIEFPLAE